MDIKKLERKTLEIKFKQESFVEDDEYYTFSGYGAVFDNIDLGKDRIKQGAFATSLKEMTPKLCYQHDMAQPLGKFTEVREDTYGLFVKGIMPKANRQCRDIAALIKCGAIDSMSIGYSTVKYAYDEDSDILDLIELKLYEVSLVTLPMNPKATLTAFKSQNPNWSEEIKSIRDIEVILKEADFSAKEAKTIISKIKELTPRDEDENPEVEIKTNEECDAALKVLSLLDKGLENSILQGIEKFNNHLNK